ncbi:hypothetical protein [uncultured Acetatifactor sp.]|nr:hypothetical protein [uncultured Acetatifactor sp.]
MGELKQHQPPLAIGEQIENLKEIGLIVAGRPILPIGIRQK